MLFNSYVFIFAFLPIVLGVYLMIRRATASAWPIGWLTASSLVYFGWWDPKYLALLLLSMTVNYAFARTLMGSQNAGRRATVLLTLGVTFNLCLLGYFKYAAFVVTNAKSLFGADWLVPQIVLPIGISFYTFQDIALLVDAYRGKVRNLTPLNYALFLIFFPQLIAGPIVHQAEMMPLFGPAQRRPFLPDFAVGVSIFIVGLFKKVIVADFCAVYADAGYAAVHAGQPLDPASAWITVLCYSFQLYYDFSGYSDMAVGLARMFGLTLAINFYSPYQSTSITEFWRRWHMTLSRFLRDYLYIPLGGNRCGAVRRYLNLVVVMLLGGFWHGANWTFVLWGGVHGVLLVVHHAWLALPVSREAFFATATARWMGRCLTFLSVTLAWVPFRAASLSEASAVMTQLLPGFGSTGWASSFSKFWHSQFGEVAFQAWFRPRELWPPVLPADYLATGARPVGWLLLIVGLATFFLPNTVQIFRRFDPALGVPDEPEMRWGGLQRLDVRVSVILGGMFVLSVLGLARVSPFLYFQF